MATRNVTTMLDYNGHPFVVRVLALLGGAGMTTAPMLGWTITSNLAGRPVRESGLDTGFGIVVLASGIATILIGVFPRFLPLAILTGLVGGAAAGLYLVESIPLKTEYFPGGFIREFDRGLVLALGSAAITGASGIAALAVASAVNAQPRE
jgi:hypothetical protein